MLSESRVKEPVSESGVKEPIFVSCLKVSESVHVSIYCQLLHEKKYMIVIKNANIHS